jgi:hypothetical protein
MLIDIFVFFLFIHVNSRCLDKEGSFILNVKIHLDEMTAMKILAVEKAKRAFSESKTNRQMLVEYLNGIFHDMNKDLKDVGVQLKGDYSNLIFEELETELQKEKLCMNKVMAIEATTRLVAKLSYPNTEGLGLRIVALSCLAFDPIQIPFFALPIGGCGNLGTIFVIEPFTLKFQIKNLVKNFISEGIGAMYSINSETYKNHVCHFANKCAVKNSHFGKFEKHLEKVDFINKDGMLVKKSNNNYRN